MSDQNNSMLVNSQAKLLRARWVWIRSEQAWLELKLLSLTGARVHEVKLYVHRELIWHDGLDGVYYAINSSGPTLGHDNHGGEISMPVQNFKSHKPT